MTTNDDQRRRGGGPAAALAWTRTRDDLPRAPWTDEAGLPLRAATTTDLRRRHIIAPTDDTTLGRTLRLRATVEGRYGLTPRQRATVLRGATTEARPYLDVAHALVLDEMTRRATANVGGRYSTDDGTAPLIAKSLRHAQPVAAWQRVVRYIEPDGTLPIDVRVALRDDQPQLAAAYEEHRRDIARAIARGADCLASTDPSDRRRAYRQVRRLADTLALLQDHAGRGNTATDPRYPHGQPSGRTPDPHGDNGLWDQLTVDQPPLVVANYARTGRTYIPADMGRHPRYMARALTDPSRRVFHRRGGFRHATIVADLSGSMSLTDADVAAIVDAARGCSLLAYRSCRGLYTAQVIARDGRTCEPAKRFRAGGGNGVDGPALTWAHRHLRRHGAPLIWISDGGITGRSESTGPQLARDMVTRLRHTGAHHVPNVPAALALLAAMRAGHRPRPEIGQQLVRVMAMD